jgi:L-malate glycosyltransferase
VGRLAGRLCGVPVVYTEHNRLERYHSLTRALSLSTWRWQDRAIAVSDDVADSIRLHAGYRVPMEVVLNGVDVEHFDRQHGELRSVREEFGLPSGSRIVGTVAVFRPQKRLHDWLEAARILRKGDPELQFLLVGDGPLRADLVASAESLGLGDCVHWAGLQLDVRPYLAAMDLYMMSSSVEGLPIALLEAMSMRCPVVATAVGGIPEVIRHGENGFLVGPSRPEQLAEMARRVLGSPGRMEGCGEAARSTVEKGFSVHRMACQLEATYLDVVSRYRNGH